MYNELADAEHLQNGPAMNSYRMNKAQTTPANISSVKFTFVGSDENHQEQVVNNGQDVSTRLVNRARITHSVG